MKRYRIRGWRWIVGLWMLACLWIVAKPPTEMKGRSVSVIERAWPLVNTETLEWRHSEGLPVLHSSVDGLRLVSMLLTVTFGAGFWGVVALTRDEPE